ncbi:MAG: Ig-like domain-containing protein [Bacteroidales bacterium]|nr:Ig-like domain-containing protein [Bacteroidales bacterium]
MFRKIVTVALAVVLAAGCQKKVDIIWPTSVHFEQESVSIKVGEVVTLKPVFEPEQANLYTKYFGVQLFTSDPSVAGFHKNGSVIGLSPGTATITVLASTSVTDKDGNMITSIGNTCTVVVANSQDVVVGK